MTKDMPALRTFQGELRALLTMIRLVSEHATNEGDAHSAAVLENTAALLAMVVAQENSAIPGAARTAPRSFYGPPPPLSDMDRQR